MQHSDNNRYALFIVPRASTAWKGNEAGWITTSGWASAGKALWGDSRVVTTDGVFTPEESMLFPRGNHNVAPTRSSKGKIARKVVPEFVITGFKDWKLKRSKPQVWPVETNALLNEKKAMMVWERHDLFSGPGRKLADRLNVPLVISVEAAAVWEAEKWGVKRPVWGKLLERYSEAASLKKADLVSCVSEEVRDKVIEMGVDPKKVIVSHNRVDSSVFNPGIKGEHIKKQYNLEGKTVIGWTGSFRNFHGLDTVLAAFKTISEKHKDAVLMLVGDGLEYEKTNKLAEELGISDKVIFTGRKPFTEIPGYLANFDIALVSANSAEGFHYSPLKLREYLAMGKAVIAPRAGNLPELFKDGNDLVFYEAGNGDNLAVKMELLLKDVQLRQKLVTNAIAFFEKEGTWVHELKIVCDKLGIAY